MSNISVYTRYPATFDNIIERYSGKKGSLRMIPAIVSASHEGHSFITEVFQRLHFPCELFYLKFLFFTCKEYKRF